MPSALIRRLGIGRSRTCPFSPQLTRLLVHPAYQSMLGHIRSGTLDRFKDAFHKALNRGDEFSVAACDCTESFTSLFDEGCAVGVFGGQLLMVDCMCLCY
ncbi:hypothetical protein CsSME_00051581 [Camellia sinensis var. sinensis]